MQSIVSARTNGHAELGKLGAGCNWSRMKERREVLALPYPLITPVVGCHSNVAYSDYGKDGQGTITTSSRPSAIFSQAGGRFYAGTKGHMPPNSWPKHIRVHTWSFASFYLPDSLCPCILLSLLFLLCCLSLVYHPEPSHTCMLRIREYVKRWYEIPRRRRASRS
jgi:hypothetical protein